MSRRRLVRWILVLASCRGATAHAQQTPTPTPGQVREVTMFDSFYWPAMAEVDVGTSVVWRHGQGSVRPHSVTAQPGAPETFDSSPNCSGSQAQACILPGATFQRRFDTPGTYAYYCRVDGRADVAPDPTKDQAGQPCGMCGLLSVRVPASPSPSASPTPTPRVVPSGAPRTTRPAFVVAAPSRTGSPLPSPSPSATVAPAPSLAPAAIPISTPEPASGSSGAGGLAGVAAAATALGIAASGYLAWRRRPGPPV